MPGQFDESKHPRDGGKFSSKPGSGGEKKEDNTKVKDMGDVNLNMKNPESEDHHPYAENAVETFHSKEQASKAGGKQPVEDENTGHWYKDNDEWQKAHGGDVIDIKTWASAEDAKADGRENPVVDEESGLWFSSNVSWQTAHGGANARAFADKTLHIMKPRKSSTSKPSAMGDVDLNKKEKTKNKINKAVENWLSGPGADSVKSDLEKYQTFDVPSDVKKSMGVGSHKSESNPWKSWDKSPENFDILERAVGKKMNYDFKKREFKKHPEQANAKRVKKETGGKYHTKKQLNHKMQDMYDKSSDPKQKEALKKLMFEGSMSRINAKFNSLKIASMKLQVNH